MNLQLASVQVPEVQAPRAHEDQAAGYGWLWLIMAHSSTSSSPYDRPRQGQD